jgi:hypothetical protein
MRVAGRVALAGVLAGALSLAGCGPKTRRAAAPSPSAITATSPAPSPTTPASVRPRPDIFAFTAVNPALNPSVEVVSGGRVLQLPPDLFADAAATYPVGWLDVSGDRLLVGRLLPGNPVPGFFAVDVRIGAILGQQVAPQGGVAVAANDPQIVGGLSGNKVIRYDSLLNTVSSAPISGLPAGAAATLLGARATGVVVSVPLATGGTRLATIGWDGTARLLPALEIANMAIRDPVVSPDGAQLAFADGIRTATGAVVSPRVVDLTTGTERSPLRPAALSGATRLEVHDVHWTGSSISFAWQDNRAGDGTDVPVVGGVRPMPPVVYSWAPTDALMSTMSAALFVATLPSGQRLAVQWSAAAQESFAGYPLFLAGRRIAVASDAFGPPVAP